MAGILRVGTSGFAYPAWAPRFYPAGTRGEGLLRHYGERLATWSAHPEPETSPVAEHSERMAPESTSRARAGISFALTEAMDEGHCGLPTAELIPLAEKLLEVPQQLIQTALDLELSGDQ